MATIMTASKQWLSRPSDERFLSLTDMLDHFNSMKQSSREYNFRAGQLFFRPAASDPDELEITTAEKKGAGATMTNWSFGQLTGVAKAPAAFLRQLPTPMVADVLNHVFETKRANESVKALIHRRQDGQVVFRAATSPTYGRIWNSEVCAHLLHCVGDGVTGTWRVPGEFGKAVTVNNENTTLYGSDRDMWIFLADEENRIEIPRRRYGQPGSLARGFFVWNSEVGAASLGIATFLFDYVCANRIIWGAEDYLETRIRHSTMANFRWTNEIIPALDRMHAASTAPIVQRIASAQRITFRPAELDEFMAPIFGKGVSEAAQAVHLVEEERPIESLWDIVTGVTAHARSIANNDTRIELEKKAGSLLNKASR